MIFFLRIQRLPKFAFPASFPYHTRPERKPRVARTGKGRVRLFRQTDCEGLDEIIREAEKRR